MALSPKELKVLTLVALGYSDKEIGVELKIAYGTVRNKDWLEDIYEKNNYSLDCRRVLSD